MNAQTLKRLSAALALLLVVWVGATLIRRAGRDEAGTLSNPRFSPGDVDAAVLAGPADTLRFARSGAAWTVNGNRADAKLVGELLAALGDSAGRSQLVSEAASSHERLGLDSAAARRLTLRQGSRVVADLLVGRRGSDYGTVFARMPGEATAYQLSGRLGDASDRPADDWRDKVIAAVEPDSVAALEVRYAKGNYRLVRGDSGWALGVGRADSSAVAGLLDRFRSLTAAGFATAAQADSADFGQPDKVVRLWARGDRSLMELSADSSASGFWVRRAGDPTTFRLDTWMMGQLTPAESTLRKR